MLEVEYIKSLEEMEKTGDLRNELLADSWQKVLSNDN